MITRQLQPRHFTVLARRYGEMPDQELVYNAVLEICAAQMDEEDIFINFIALLVCPTWTYQEQ